MKKIVLAVAALVLLSGCSDTPSEPKFGEAKENLLHRLKDPDSARFRNTFYKKSGYNYTLCGYVNSKNSMGGYVGFRKFLHLWGRVGFEPEEGFLPGYATHWVRCQTEGTKFTW